MIPPHIWVLSGIELVLAVLMFFVLRRLYRDVKKYQADKKAPSEQISIIIPFTSSDPVRLRIFNWVLAYWKAAMPDAEVIVAPSDAIPFHKTKAVNDGVARSSGDIVVIMDADCYMSAATISKLAERMRTAREEKKHLWYIPYRRFYRLTEHASNLLLASSPTSPMPIIDPPPPGWVEHIETSSSGHHWGALVQMMPREAFIDAGGMDERFQGWGGEDVSFMHALDTVWGKHKTFDGPVFHIWHPTIKGNWKYTRQWPGQRKAETNDKLSSIYQEALNDRTRMYRVMRGETD